MNSIPLALAAGKFPRAIGHIMLDHDGELFIAATARSTEQEQMLLARVHINRWSPFIEKVLEPIA